MLIYFLDDLGIAIGPSWTLIKVSPAHGVQGRYYLIRALLEKEKSSYFEVKTSLL